MSIQIRALTPLGLDQFLRYFSKIDLETGEKVTVRKSPPPRDLITDDRFSVPIPVDAVLTEGVPANKIDMARRVLDALGDNFDDYVTNRHMWAWLTILWSEAVIPYSESEEGWRLHEISVYDIGDDKRGAANYNIIRHRVWGPTIIFRRWGMLSRSMLADPINRLGDEIDVFMFRNVLTEPVLKAYDLLYFDTSTRSIREPENKRQKDRRAEDLRPGDIHDYVDQVLQIARTYSISKIDPQRIIKLLPKAEFGAHVAHANARLRIGDVPPSVPML